MSAPTALYRRYRPDSFADVIGQEHVTAPLMAALEKNRVNHAYLFSGPRGCGKTTSARILARCLNCTKGPTAHPCGECESCMELARGGAGSLDVIEIDAASHGGVDDARDLRERATFAPIRDRYKIFIIDEAHMVTSAGFNALLKIVEEPPEHIKFIFATTEPDKVIGTIRSRTHHYPFRLVPPEPLMAYLAHLCEQEGVPVAPGVLSLVIRAGGGSVRDSLSVLDQLMAGAGSNGLDYELAVDLLGYTHASLLDDVVEALAAGDSATLFKSVDKVIQTGHDPRRFVEDLLERFRDLIIVAAMPESAHAILRGTPDELIARMQTQAAQLGPAELSRAADVTNTAFNEMTGATSPRLHLELLAARLLLPGADDTARGMAARLDQMERRLNYGGVPAGGPAAAPAAAPAAFVPGPASPAPAGSTPAPADIPVAPGGGLAAVRAQIAKAKSAAGAEVASRHASEESGQGQAPAPVPLAEPEPSAAAPVEAPREDATAAAAASWGDLPNPAQSAPSNTAPREGSHQPDAQQAPVQQQPVQRPTAQQPPMQQAPMHQVPVGQEPVPPQPMQPAPGETAPPAQPAAPAEAPATGAVSAPEAGTRAGQGGTSGIEVIRRAWPEILGNLSNIRKASWAIVNQNVVPRAFDGQTLRVALPTTALIQTFEGGGHAENLRHAIHTTLGITCQLDPITGDGPTRESGAEPNPKGPADPRRIPDAGVSMPLAAAKQPERPVQGQAAGQQTNGPAPTAGNTAPVAARPLPPTGKEAPVVAAPAMVAPAPAAEPAQVHMPAAPLEVAAAPAKAERPAPRQGVPVSEWTGPVPEEPSWAEEPPYDDWGPEPGWAVAPAADAPTASEVPSWSATATPAQPATAQPPAAIPTQPSTAVEAAPTQPSTAAGPTPAQQSPDPAFPEPTSNAAVGPASTTGHSAAPVAPHTPYRPKVSPITAWTTGWDAPEEESPPAAPAAPEAPATPRRSELLAAQAQKMAQQDSPQDWGVSLGAAATPRVADPGWGAPANAPDWASPAPGNAAPTGESTVPAAGSTTPNLAAPAATGPDAQSAVGVSEGTASNIPSGGGYLTSQRSGAAETAPGAPSGGGYLTSQRSGAAETAPGAPSGGGYLTSQPGRAGEAASGGGYLEPQPGGGKLSMYQRLSNSPEARAGRVQQPAAGAVPVAEDVPSPDDVTIEESGVAGQAAVERILGGQLIEERPLNGGR